MATPTPTSPGVAPRRQPVCAISPPALPRHASPRLSIIRPRPAFLSSSISRETISVRSRPPMPHCSLRRAAGRSDSSPRSPGCVRCTSASPRCSKRAACCSLPSTSTRCRPQRLSTSSAPRRIRACSVPTRSATASTSRAVRCAFWSSTAFRGRARTFCTAPASRSSAAPQYSDQIARLRLRQAYGRLVRRADDRGVFVILDRALPSRLLSAFPSGVAVARVPLVAAVEETAQFLGAVDTP